MSVGELDEGLAGGRLRLPDADDREHVPERCQTVVMVTNVRVHAYAYIALIALWRSSIRQQNIQQKFNKMDKEITLAV